MLKFHLFTRDTGKDAVLRPPKLPKNDLLNTFVLLSLVFGIQLTGKYTSLVKYTSLTYAAATLPYPSLVLVPFLCSFRRLC